jgi:diadenosine tetraphosphate (Ap4A) HIT family hydrolase
MPFLLHPQLEADTIEIARLPLSVVRLMNDRTWPWLVLVPERPDAVEILDLDRGDRRQLMDEVALASAVLRDLFQPQKLNVAALGNQVAQLHVHVIARFLHDPAWPRPVWGVVAPEPYRPHERETTMAALQDGFARSRAQYLEAEAEAGTEEPGRLWSFFGFTDR